MKKLILLSALLFVGLGYSQTYRISTVGESKQFVIEDVDNGVRERPYLNREVLADTTSQGNINIYRQLAVDYLKPIGFPKVAGRAYTEFVDGNNSDATFASAAAVLTWFADNTGFNSASGGSGAGGDGSVKYKADDYTALSALSSPSTGDIAIVTDAGIGGTFIYDSTLSATDNGGTIIDGWVRQFDGAVHTDWWGTDGPALQASIDYVESLTDGGKVIVDQKITTAQDINIAGDVEISIEGNGPTEIFTSFPGYTVNVGNISSNTSKQVNLTDLIIRDGGLYATKLKIMNHIRFNGTRLKLSEGSEGAIVTTRGDGAACYQINFDQCEFTGNLNYGLYILAENGGGYNYTNDVNVSNSYIADNNVNVRIEIESGAGDATAHKFSNVYIDNGDPTKRNLEIVGSHGNFFNGVTFDGRQDGLDEITLDADTYDNYFSGTRIIDGSISDLGTRNKFDYGLPSVNYFTESRNISISDIQNTLSVENTGTLTITEDFDTMLRHQYIYIQTRKKVLTIQGASGVTVNGVSAGSTTVGTASDYVWAIMRKTNTNSYEVYGSGSGGGGITASGTPVSNQITRFGGASSVKGDATLTYTSGDANVMVMRAQTKDSYFRMAEFSTSWLGAYIRYDNLGNKIDFGGHNANTEDIADDVPAFSISRDGTAFDVEADMTLQSTIELETAGEGMILKSPDGTRYKVTVANGGTLTVTAL